MGLFKKIIDVFYDPVEGEETEEEKEIVKKEEKKEIKPEEKIRIEEVHIPREEVKKEESPVYSERDIFKTEPKTFKFPILEEEEKKEKPVVRTTRSSIYNDEDFGPKKETKFERLENVKREINRETPREEKVRETKPETKVETGEKKFKLTPPISPIYGILDKNYKKEDITIRKEPIIHRSDDMNYDSVRRKAYGTLEDELENTLTKISKNNEEIEKTIEETDNFNIEENNKSIEDLLNEIEGNKNMSIGEIEEKIKDSIEEDEEVPTFRNVNDEIFKETIDKEPEVREEETESFDKTLEHDLFNLIDSMYEDKENE